MSKKEFRGTKVHTRYRLKDGTLVPGATTVLRMIDKSGPLMRWAWKLGLEGIDYNKYRDKAAEVGTLAHYMIECELSGKEPDLTEYSPELIDKAENCLISWYEWRKSHDLEPILIEEPMVSERYKFGGTIDCCCILNGTKTLLDFKTGKGIYPSMLVQLSAYRNLLEENGHSIQQAVILNIGRQESEQFQTRFVGLKDMDELWEGFFVPALTMHWANKKWKVVS